MTDASSHTRALFPDGRIIFYEGDDPDGFAAEIKTEFGFDPSQNPEWGYYSPADEGYDPVKYVEWRDRMSLVSGEVPIELRTMPPGGPSISWGFHCPVEHLDTVWGSRRWPLGS